MYISSTALAHRRAVLPVLIYSFILWQISLLAIPNDFFIGSGIGRNVVVQAAEHTSLASLSRDGSLPQIIYAERAIARSEPSLGVITRGRGAVLAALRPRRRKLKIEEESKLELIDDKIALCVSGYAPDCKYVRSKILSIVESHRLLFGETISLKGLSSELSSWFAQQLTPGSDKMLARPIAVCVVLASAPEVPGNEPRLVVVRNSGACERCRSVISGQLNASVVSRDAIYEQMRGAASSPIAINRLKHLLSRTVASSRTLECLVYNASDPHRPWRRILTRISPRIERPII